MNIGILGAGSFGETHIKVLKNIKTFNIQGFHDPNQEISKNIVNKFKRREWWRPLTPAGCDNSVRSEHRDRFAGGWR